MDVPILNPERKLAILFEFLGGFSSHPQASGTCIVTESFPSKSFLFNHSPNILSSCYLVWNISIVAKSTTKEKKNEYGELG
jgi:hypothetical protein